jgi:hypothetical protein
MPLRYVMSMRDFVRMNRTCIKLTHWPLLFCIFVYEKYFLASSIYEPTDLVENYGHSRSRVISFADPASRTAIFSPNVRAREGSIAGQQQDRALEEVFKHPPDAGALRQQRRQERRKSQTAIRTWMEQNDDNNDDDDGDPEPPASLWPTMDSRRSGGSRFTRRFRTVSDVRSAASDPADLMSNSGFPLGRFGQYDIAARGQQREEKDQTDADGDDELVTNDEDEDEVATEDQRGSRSHQEAAVMEDYFTTPVATRFGTLAPSSFSSARSSKPLTATASPRAGPSRRQGLHSRTLSTNTILYAPQSAAVNSESEEPIRVQPRPKSNRQTPIATPISGGGYRSPRKIIYAAPPTRPRPIPSKTAPARPPLLSAPDPRLRKLPSIDVDINSDMGLDHDGHNDFGAVPSSFATQMALATGQLKGLMRNKEAREDSDRMSRLVLARMKTLEEGFADVVREIRVIRSTVPTAQNSGDDGSLTGQMTMEVAGNDRRRFGHPKRPKGDRSRPVSVRENRVGMKPKAQDKGKGKEVARSSESGDTLDVRRVRRRGSSF